MFFDKGLQDLDEPAIRALIETEAEEGLGLEFKGQLDLASKEEKREAAKDASAFANAAGGRIVYGLAEKKLDNGRVVAGEITPIQDGSIRDRLSDVLAGAISPRPAFAMTNVPIAGGVVLVLEVYRSETDLHMVTGYGENRFYKRGATGNVLMTEPEVREAYAQIGTTRASLERTLAEAIDPELALRSRIDESIIVAPWHTSPSFLDPRRLPPLGEFVADALRDTQLWKYSREMTLGADGYRAVLGRDGEIKPETAPLYLAVLRTGVVHWSYDSALRWNDDRSQLTFWPVPAIERIVETLIMAERVYEALEYHGRCRLRFILRPQAPLLISPTDFSPLEPVPAKAIDLLPSDFQFAELGGKYGTVVRDVMDQVFQLRGDRQSPYFSPQAELLAYPISKISAKGVLTRLT